MAPFITTSGDVTSDPTVKAVKLNGYFPHNLFNFFQRDYIIIASGLKPLLVLSIDPVFTIVNAKFLGACWTQSYPADRTVSPIYALKTVKTHYLHL